MSFSTEIGRDTIGIIFTDNTPPQIKSGVANILKRTIKPNIDPRNWLREDALWHKAISTAMAGTVSESYLKGPDLPCVTELVRLIEPDSSWWSSLAVGHQWIIPSCGDEQRDDGSCYVEQYTVALCTKDTERKGSNSTRRTPTVLPIR